MYFFEKFLTRNFSVDGVRLLVVTFTAIGYMSGKCCIPRFGPPRTRPPKGGLPLLYAVAFIVRGNVSHLFGQRPLTGRYYWVTAARTAGSSPPPFHYTRIHPQKMLKHLLHFFKTANFTGAYGVLHFSNNTLRVLLVAVATERLEFLICTP
jgi:hypothetical protein